MMFRTFEHSECRRRIRLGMRVALREVTIFHLCGDPDSRLTMHERNSFNPLGLPVRLPFSVLTYLLYVSGKIRLDARFEKTK